MKRHWREALAALWTAATAACVSFDATGSAVPDVTGTYTATIALTLSNDFEIRNDTLAVSLDLRTTGQRGRFAGSYAIAPSESGVLEGTMFADGTFWLTAFGAPPKPIAGVFSIRALYPWCDFSLLGMPAVRGALAGDSLHASVEGSVPCFYQVEDRTLNVHTRLLFALTGVR